MSENLSPLRQVYEDMARLYFVYEKPTYRDALELFLRPFAGQIFQSGGSLHIRRTVSMYNAILEADTWLPIASSNLTPWFSATGHSSPLVRGVFLLSIKGGERISYSFLGRQR